MHLANNKIPQVKMPKVSGVVFKEQVAQLSYVPLDKARCGLGTHCQMHGGSLLHPQLAMKAACSAARALACMGQLAGTAWRAATWSAESPANLTPPASPTSATTGSLQQRL